MVLARKQRSQPRQDVDDQHSRERWLHPGKYLLLDRVGAAARCRVVAVAMTGDGTKVPVGRWKGASTDTRVTSLLADLVDRGLDATRGLLVVAHAPWGLRSSGRCGGGPRTRARAGWRHRGGCAVAGGPGDQPAVAVGLGLTGRPARPTARAATLAGMDVDDLPDGLPPGRLLAPDAEQPARWTDSPVCWVSAQPLVDAVQQWARLHAIRDRTGLWPVLLGSIVAGEQQRPPPWSCDPRELDALDAEAILQEKWRYLVRLDQETVGDRLWMAEGPQGTRIVDALECPEGFQALPEGVRVLNCWTVRYEGEERMVFVEEWAKRFVTWPGLAPPGVAGRDPDIVAREVVASMRPPFTPAFLGLVPVACSADLSAVIGWATAGDVPLGDHELSAVLRSWEQRFGAQVVALTGSVDVSVAAPPRTRGHAEQLALEHLLLCPDNLHNQGDWTFPGYVDRILGANLWKFHWD